MMSNPTTASQPISVARIQGFLSTTYKSKFVRDVAVVASGTAGAQAITMAFAPVITRLYGPEAFGLLGTFMAIVAIVTPIAALSYPIAIVLPKEEREARGIARLSAFIALGMAALLALVLLIARHRIVELLQVQEISSFIMLIPLVIVFTACLQINQQWLIRKKQFKITARVAVLQAFLINSAKAGMGLLKPVGAVLIVLSTFGSALHAFMLSIGAKKSDKGQQIEKLLSKAPLWKLAKRHQDFPFFRAPQMFINAVSQSLPVLMLASFFGPAAAGFYAIGKNVLGLPSSLIAGSVGDVFYPRITEAAHKGENLTKLVIKATLALAAVGFWPFALVIAFGPWLFGFVFGAKWVVAGEYARWLALWMFFMFLNNPSIKSLPVISAQGFHLIFTLFTITTRVIVLAAGYYIFDSDLIAVALFGISGALINIILITIIFVKCLKFDKAKLQRTF
jgi:O-antigen/teichoic acid export membrane protein